MLLAKPLICTAALCVGSALFGYVERDNWLGVCAGLLSLACVRVFIGVWNAQEWARWTLGILCALGAVAIQIPFITGTTSLDHTNVKISITLGVGAVLALNPSMKRHFATVRDVLAGRDVRGRRPRRRSEKPATIDRTPRRSAARNDDAPPNAGAQ